MKKSLVFALFLVIFTSCQKEEQDCNETVQCWTITHSFTVCDVQSGVYNFKNIRSDTSYSIQSVCKVDWYIKSAEIGEKRLYDATDDVGRAFIDLKPIECGCDD